MARFEIVIQNNQPLSFLELREIVAIIDDHIADEAGLYRRSGRRKRPYYLYDEFDVWGPAVEDDFSFVEIEAVRPGSIILTIVTSLSGVWGLGAVALGLRRSRLGSQLTKFGENAGNILSNGLAIVNERLEDWSQVNERLRERATKVRVEEIARDEDPQKLPPPKG